MILGCADSTLRKQVLKGEFKEGEYRKAKGTNFFYRAIIEEIKNKGAVLNNALYIIILGK